MKILFERIKLESKATEEKDEKRLVNIKLENKDLFTAQYIKLFGQTNDCLSQILKNGERIDENPDLLNEMKALIDSQMPLYQAIIAGNFHR